MSKGRILVVDDDPKQSNLLREILGFEGFEVHAASSAAQAIAAAQEKAFQAVVSDLRMPDMDGIALSRKIREILPDAPFVIMTAHGTVDTALTAMKEGVYDYILKPVHARDLVATLDKAFEVTALKVENRSLKDRIAEQAVGDSIVFGSKKMEEVLDVVRTVAKSDATVLIRGESGTGKELIADALHRSSPRTNGPFIKVNCAAIPATLLEDELFGHEKGAFTDAKADRKGKFELAHGGTIFLDEIGDMPAPLQVKILRVLQERCFDRIGGTKTVHVDVRLIAATHRDLEEAIRGGEFRQDLYYRLNVIAVNLPPLRERGEDVIKLAAHFLQKFNAKNQKHFKGFTSDAQRALQGYPWPGNVRELENAIERAVVLGTGELIEAQHLPANLGGTPRNRNDFVSQFFETDLTLEGLEQELIRRALERAGWNQSKAARLLGLTRRTLQYRIEKYDIRKNGDGAQPTPAPRRPSTEASIPPASGFRPT